MPKGKTLGQKLREARRQLARTAVPSWTQKVSSYTLPGPHDIAGNIDDWDGISDALRTKADELDTLIQSAVRSRAIALAHTEGKQGHVSRLEDLIHEDDDILRIDDVLYDFFEELNERCWGCRADSNLYWRLRGTLCFVCQSCHDKAH